ncbi:MAG: hypothetical protein Q4D16_18195 [Eubacteriales bacterium]|nr:hypothetical protein [Eubacteriales bacterium]
MDIFTSEPSLGENTQNNEETVFTDALAAEKLDETFSDEEMEEPITDVLSQGGLSAAEIEWDNDNQEYWNKIIWSEVDWTDVDWSKVPPKNYVAWNKIDWSTIPWESLDGDYNIVQLLDVTKVDWAIVDWSTVDWSEFYNWPKELEHDKVIWDNEDMFWEAVDWSAVNWDKIRWKSLDVDKVQLANKGRGWDEVDFSKVKWDKMDWSKIKALNDNSKYGVSYSLEFPKKDPITDTIETVIGGDSWAPTIPSDNVKISIKSAKTPSPYVVEPSSYTVLVEDQGNDIYHFDKIKYVGQNGDGTDIFSTSDKKISIKAALPALDDASYWDIKVDDSQCSFAVEKKDRVPKVTIKAINGILPSGDEGSELKEGEDFKVEVIDSYPEKCGTKKIKILPLPSKNISGIASEAKYMTRDYTVHYANISDYYTIEGIPAVIKYDDSYPMLTHFVNTGNWKENVYLKEKQEDMGDLPKIGDRELWCAIDCLTLEFQYDGNDGDKWLSSWDWPAWAKNHTSDTVRVKISVVTSKGDVYEDSLNPSNWPPRYLEGDIYGSFKVLPYSLNETENQKPPTEVLENGNHYLARVNPKETMNSKLPDRPDLLDNVENGDIAEATYNGQAQEPAFDLALYEYSDWQVGRGDYFYSKKDSLPAYTLEYKDNVNAGEASVIISFAGGKGDFTGSITRHFTIKPKDITDTSIDVDHKDFIYDGTEHLPQLIIQDSEAGTLLKEGTDYTVQVVTQNTTNPGNVEVKVIGMGNYEGSTTTKYKIISTSSGSSANTIADASRYEITAGTVVYNGKPQLPEVAVTDKVTGSKLEQDTDYRVEAVPEADNTNAGIGKVKITGIRMNGTLERSFIIKAKELDDTFRIEALDVTYDGKAQLPQVIVEDTGLKATLAAEKDFILYAQAGADNTNPGTGKAVIRGIGNYTGTQDISFKIIEAFTDADGNTHYADGSIQSPGGTYLRPGKVTISLAKAAGNKVSVFLAGEARGAAGYDYVIGTSSDMLKTKDYYRVNKNVLKIFTDMYYVNPGTYYAACHAWTRDADGRKIFGTWSELRELNVTSVTPGTPKITNVKVNGSNVTVTYKKCKDAAGYDIVLGTAARKVNGELRPILYGDYVKKVTDKNTVTVTFKNVKAGTYYAGLHAYNRTGPGRQKVFSPWSGAKKLTVK